jgi:hypothetical protein
MPYYVQPFTFRFDTDRIEVDAGVVDVDCGFLYDCIKLAQASEEGIINEQIGSGSGLQALGPGVQTGLTVELLGAWQLQFPTGNYIARVAGGNLIGGPGGDPIAYSAGVQALLIQSASATVVTAGGSVPTAPQVAAAVRSELSSELLRVNELATIHGLVSGDPLSVTATQRQAGSITQQISESGGAVTVQRVA